MTDQPRPIEWTQELVNKFWNGLAEAGVDDSMAFGRMAKRCIYWLIEKHLKQDGRHLDYGAGSGEVAEYMIAQGYPFAVHDPANERSDKSFTTLNGVDGFLGVLNEEPSETYDVVTCFEVLEHVLDEEFDRVCNELVGHLKPGGTLIISTPNNENLQNDMVYCPISNSIFHRWQHVRTISPEWMEEQFAKRGIEKVVLHQLDFSEALFEPYLHMMGIGETPEGREGEIVPLHIYQVNNGIGTVCGGATRMLFIGRKSEATA